MNKLNNKQIKASTSFDAWNDYFINGKQYISEDGNISKHYPTKYESFVPKDKMEIHTVNSVTNGFIGKERVDISLFEMILHSNEINNLSVHHLSKDVWGNLQKQMVAYIDRRIGDFVKTKYEIPQSCHYYGRTSCELSLSLGVFKRQIRHALCKDYYVDIDIENAQPQLLYQFCKYQGIECAVLEDYVLNREIFFNEVANSYKLQDGTPLNIKVNGKWKYRDILKNLFIIFLFYGSFEAWVIENKIDNKAKIDDCMVLKDFKQELMKIGNTIMFHNKKFFNLVNTGIKEKTKKRKDGVDINYFNPLGRSMSIFLQEYERRVLDVVFEYLVENKVIIDNEVILCFDGLMVPTKYWKLEFLTKLNLIVKEKLGFDLNFTTKDMTEGDNILSKLQHYNFTQIDIRRFSKIVFDKLTTYSQKKKYFERFFYKVRHPTSILQIYYNEDDNTVKDGDTYFYGLKASIFHYDLKGFEKAFSDLRYVDYDMKTDKMIEKCFVDTWLKDANIKISQTIEFLPMNKTESEMLELQAGEDFKANLFTGYNDIIKMSHLNYDEKGVKEWLRLIEDLCEGCKKNRDYYVKILAKKIREPTKKIPIGIVILGEQGTGKNKHLEPIFDIVGLRHSISSSKESDFFGEYAEGFQNKLFVNMNEVEGRNTMDLQGRMKSFITEDKVTVNMKFVRPIEIKNYSLLSIFSNKVNPIQIDIRSGDRRWVVFKSKGAFKGKTTYWNRISELFKSNQFLYSLYQYLMNINLDNFCPIRERPITKSYINLASLSIPKEVLFIEHLYTDSMSCFESNQFDDSREYEEYKNNILDEERQIKGKHLFNDFSDFCKGSNLINEATKLTEKRFYADLINLECGFSKSTDKHSGAVVLGYKLRTVLENLTKRRLIMVDDNKNNIETKKEIIMMKQSIDNDDILLQEDYN